MGLVTSCNYFQTSKITTLAVTSLRIFWYRLFTRQDNERIGNLPSKKWNSSDVQNRTVISNSEPRTNKYEIIMVIKEIYTDE